MYVGNLLFGIYKLFILMSVVEFISCSVFFLTLGLSVNLAGDLMCEDARSSILDLR